MIIFSFHIVTLNRCTVPISKGFLFPSQNVQLFFGWFSLQSKQVEPVLVVQMRKLKHSKLVDFNESHTRSQGHNLEMNKRPLFYLIIPVTNLYIPLHSPRFFFGNQTADTVPTCSCESIRQFQQQFINDSLGDHLKCEPESCRNHCVLQKRRDCAWYHLPCRDPVNPVS